MAQCWRPGDDADMMPPARLQMDASSADTGRLRSRAREDGMPGQVYKGNELASGITTELRIDDEPPRLVVESLAYEGGFRGTGLRAGDSIVAIDGVPITRMPPERLSVEGPQMPGQYQEGQ